MISAKSRGHYHFHPNELAFCGYSGSGKTTLIEKLAKIWESKSIQFAYLKHDAHGFSIDHPGKDSFRIREAGASLAVINDEKQTAFVSSETNPQKLRNIYIDSDFLIVEGYKDLAIPKIIVLDDFLKILQKIPYSDDHQQVAYVGPWPTAPLFLNRPYFHRDDIASLESYILNHFSTTSFHGPLHGLILAGGRSQRMGRDKALLCYYQGQNQLQRCHDLLKPFCSEVYLSLRHDQAKLEEYKDYQSIEDSFLNLGPLGGVLSAMQRHRDAAFLVLAIDLPAVTESVIQKLIDGRNSFRFATAFQSKHEDFPEPLCTLYEAKSFTRILSELPFGLKCPTKFLKQSRIQLLTTDSLNNDLLNVNFPQERLSFLDSRSSP